QVGEHPSSCLVERDGERRTMVWWRDATAPEVHAPSHPRRCDGVPCALVEILGAVLLLLEQEPAGRIQRVPARLVLLDHGARTMQLARALAYGLAVAGEPDKAVVQCGLATPLHPRALGALFEGQVAKVDADGGVVARIKEAHVVGATAVREPARPGE